MYVVLDMFKKVSYRRCRALRTSKGNTGLTLGLSTEILKPLPEREQNSKMITSHTALKVNYELRSSTKASARSGCS